MASENEASCQSCSSDPNFAVICSFLERFASQCGIPHPTFSELQEMIEDTQEVPQALIDLHVKLLRKARKSFSTEKWERTLIRFSHSYSSQDAWELERIGYKKARIAIKLRLLKMLLEAQFDLNMKFKTDINNLSAEELRGEPLGRDKMGNNYWCQFDPTANIRVYREDQDEETWELVAKDREELVALITKLSSGENIAGLEDILNDDSNSQDIENPVLDTGQEEGEDHDMELDKDKSECNCDNKLPTAAAPVPSSVEPQAMLNGNSSSTIDSAAATSLPQSDSTNNSQLTPVSNKNETCLQSDYKKNEEPIHLQNVCVSQKSTLDSKSNTNTVQSEASKKVVETKPNPKNVSKEQGNLKEKSEEKSAKISDIVDTKLSIKNKLESILTSKIASKLPISNNTKDQSDTKSFSKEDTGVKPVHKESINKLHPPDDKKDHSDSKSFCKNLLDMKSVSKESLSKQSLLSNTSETKPDLITDKVDIKLVAKEKPSKITVASDNKEQPKLVTKDKTSKTAVGSNNKEQPAGFPAVKDNIVIKENSKESSDIVSASAEKQSARNLGNKNLSIDNTNKSASSDIKGQLESKPFSKGELDSKLVSKESSSRVSTPSDKKDQVDIKLVSKERSYDSKPVSKESPSRNPSLSSALSKSQTESKPALNLSKSADSVVGNMKDFAQNKMRDLLQRPVQQISTKCVDLSSKRNVIDVTEELKQRGALMKSNASGFRGKGDGKSAPGSKLDEIFKLKRSLNPVANHPESQPLPAHFVGTSKSQLLEKMRITMNESLSMSGFSETGKFTQPISSQVSKPVSKDVEDLSVNKLKRGGPEDLSVNAPKKPHLDKEPVEPEVSEAIEEPVMLVKGEGSGKDCNTGNPGKESENLESNVKKDETLQIGKNSSSDRSNQPEEKKEDSEVKENEAKNIKSSEAVKSDIKSDETKNSGNEKDENSEEQMENKKLENSLSTNKSEVDSSQPSKIGEKKTPTLWSIDAICSSDKNISAVNEPVVQEDKVKNLAPSDSVKNVETGSAPKNTDNVETSSTSKTTDNIGTGSSSKNSANLDTGSTSKNTSNVGTVSTSKTIVKVKETETLNISKRLDADDVNTKDKDSDKRNIPLNPSEDIKKDITNYSQKASKTIVKVTSSEQIDSKKEKEALTKVDSDVKSSVTSEISSTVKDDKKEPLAMGFFFGPGCVQMGNLVELNKKSAEVLNKDIADGKKSTVDLSLKSNSDVSENLKQRKKSDPSELDDTPPEPKKTKVTSEICPNKNIDEIKPKSNESLKSDKEAGNSKVSDVSLKESNLENANLAVEPHFNNINKNASKKEVEKICQKLSKVSDKLTDNPVINTKEHSSVSLVSTIKTQIDSTKMTLNLNASNSKHELQGLNTGLPEHSTSPKKSSDKKPVEQKQIQECSPSQNEINEEKCSSGKELKVSPKSDKLLMDDVGLSLKEKEIDEKCEVSSDVSKKGESFIQKMAESQPDEIIKAAVVQTKSIDLSTSNSKSVNSAVKIEHDKEVKSTTSLCPTDKNSDKISVAGNENNINKISDILSKKTVKEVAKLDVNLEISKIPPKECDKNSNESTKDLSISKNKVSSLSSNVTSPATETPSNVTVKSIPTEKKLARQGNTSTSEIKITVKDPLHENKQPLNKDSKLNEINNENLKVNAAEKKTEVPGKETLEQKCNELKAVVEGNLSSSTNKRVDSIGTKSEQLSKVTEKEKPEQLCKELKTTVGGNSSLASKKVDSSETKSEQLSKVAGKETTEQKCNELKPTVGGNSSSAKKKDSVETKSEHLSKVTGKETIGVKCDKLKTTVGGNSSSTNKKVDLIETKSEQLSKVTGKEKSEQKCNELKTTFRGNSSSTNKKVDSKETKSEQLSKFTGKETPEQKCKELKTTVGGSSSSTNKKVDSKETKSEQLSKAASKEMPEQKCKELKTTVGGNSSSTNKKVDSNETKSKQLSKVAGKEMPEQKCKELKTTVGGNSSSTNKKVDSNETKSVQLSKVAGKEMPEQKCKELKTVAGNSSSTNKKVDSNETKSELLSKITGKETSEQKCNDSKTTVGGKSSSTNKKVDSNETKSELLSKITGKETSEQKCNDSKTTVGGKSSSTNKKVDSNETKSEQLSKITGKETPEQKCNDSKTTVGGNSSSTNKKVDSNETKSEQLSKITGKETPEQKCNDSKTTVGENSSSTNKKVDSDEMKSEQLSKVADKDTQDSQKNSDKGSLVGKVTIRDMSEILKPDIADKAKLKNENSAIKASEPEKDKSVSKNVENDVKPVSKITLKPLSQILKPELIAQANVMDLQENLKNIPESKSNSGSKTVVTSSNITSEKDSEFIPNILRKTDLLPSEKSKTVADATHESGVKTVSKVLPKGEKETSVAQIGCDAKSESKDVDGEALKESSEQVKISDVKQAKPLSEKAEKFIQETEKNILAVRQQLRLRQNVPFTPIVDEVPLRNTRLRQRNTQVGPKNVKTKSTSKVNLKQDADDDIEILPEKDPLALSDSEISESKSKDDQSSKTEETVKNISLATFSLDSPVVDNKVEPKIDTPSSSRKRRSSRLQASKETDEEFSIEKRKDRETENDEDGEAGGKRRKTKAKRAPDVNLRRSVEAKRGRKTSTSDDEGPTPETFEGAFANFVSKKSKPTIPPAKLLANAKKASQPKGSKKKDSEELEKEEKDEDNDLVDDKATKTENKEKEQGDSKMKKKPAPRASRLEIELGINPNSIVNEGNDAGLESEGRSVRASRRIAQIKIKEQAERGQIEEALRDTSSKKKETKSKDKKTASPAKPASGSSSKSKDKKKNSGNSTESSSKKSKSKAEKAPKVVEIPVVEEKSKKKKKKRPSRAFDGRNPWASTSESSSNEEEADEEEDHFEIEEEEEEIVLKSDHEFSPESDLEKDDEDYQPRRRARTAQKDEKEEGKEEEGVDSACQKCSKSDHPEWILLCDKCDKGWHASCLRPTLMLIPEGDWFCPPCQHVTLVQKLQESLRHYDKETKRRINEELRRKRLAYVGISLDNVLPISSQEKSARKVAHSFSEESSSDEGSSSEDSEESDEPVYQLRQRRQKLFNYRFSEYDDLINSAIQDELDAKGVVKKEDATAENGVNASAPINSETNGAVPDIKVDGEAVKSEINENEGVIDNKPVETKVKEKGEDGEDGEDDDDDDEDDYEDEEEDEIPRVVPRGRNVLSGGRKKHRRLNNLDVSSGEEDDGSDEDFKGSSSEEEEEEENDDYSDDSDRRPVRRSSRTRVARFDKEFINDDSDESDAPRRKKQKTRRVWQESESEESDKSWGRRKKKKSYASSSRSRSKRKKKHTRSRHRILDSDEETVKVPKRKKPKIKYGLDDPADDLPSRRTRGRKINYQEVMGSDTEEEIINKNSRKIVSDDEDEFKVEEELNEKEKNSDSESADNARGDRVGNISDAVTTDKMKKNNIEAEEDYEGAEEEEDDEEDSEDNEDEEEEEEEEGEEEEEDIDEEDEDDADEVEDDDRSKSSTVTKQDRIKENVEMQEKIDTSQLTNKIVKDKLKNKIKSDMKVSSDASKNTDNISDSSEHQLLNKPTEKQELSAKNINISKNMEKDNILTVKEMPPLKMRISNQTVTQVNPVILPSTETKFLSKSPVRAEKSVSGTVSEDLRQKLQIALSNKLKKVQDSESNSQPSEGPSEIDEIGSSEDMLEEEELDELDEDEDEEGIGDEEEEMLEEGEIPKKVANQLQNIQVMQRKTEENIDVLKKAPTMLREKTDLRPVVALQSAAMSQEIDKAVGIRVVSPLKLMANPATQAPTPVPAPVQPPAPTTMPFVRMPGGIPTQHQVPHPIGGTSEQPSMPTPPPKRRGRGRGKKQLAQEKAAQEQLAAERMAQEQQQLASTGGSVIRGMLQSSQPHSFSSVPRHFANQIPPVRGGGDGRGVQFPSIPRGRMPFPVQHYSPNSSHRLGQPPTPMFHSSHHPLDPSPSGGGPITIQSPSSKADSSVSTASASSIQGKATPPHPPYHRPQGPSPSPLRFPPPDSNPTRHSLPFIASAQASAARPPAPPSAGFPPSFHHPPNFHYNVAGYPTMMGEDALPPAAYQGSPSQYSEHFSETNPVTSDTSNSKSYDEEVGGEFGGLVSYFSSQREDDLET